MKMGATAPMDSLITTATGGTCVTTSAIIPHIKSVQPPIMSYYITWIYTTMMKYDTLLPSQGGRNVNAYY